MAVKIRLTRKGRKKAPVYRLVAATDNAPRDGKMLEVLGQYDPLQEPVFLEVKEDRIKYWLSVGAQLTDTANRLLSSKGIVDKKEKSSSNQKIKRKDLKYIVNDMIFIVFKCYGNVSFFNR